MKHTKILLTLGIASVLGCSSPDVLEPVVGKSGEGSGGGSFASVATQTTTISAMQAGTTSLLSSIRSAPSSYLVTENGVPFVRFRNITGSTAFNYLNELQVIASPDVPTVTWDQARNDITQGLSQLNSHTTLPFRVEVLSLFDWVRNNIDAMTFAQFESGMQSRLQSISTPPSIAGIPKLTAMEQFALTQGYYSLLHQIKWIYQNSPTSSAGCVIDWKEVTKAAIIGGLTTGVGVGIKGIYAGAVATGGNPAGGLIGGAIGFFGGFIVGAVSAGGIYMTADCLTQKMFSIKRQYYCFGKMTYSYSVSAPVGCSGSGEIVSVDLRDVVDFGLVPNKGKTALATSVVNDINWLLSYL